MTTRVIRALAALGAVGVCAGASSMALGQTFELEYGEDFSLIDAETMAYMERAAQEFAAMSSSGARNADGDPFAFAMTYIPFDDNEALNGAFPFLDSTPDDFIVNAIMQDAGQHVESGANVLLGAGEIDLPAGLKLILVGTRTEDGSSFGQFPDPVADLVSRGSQGGEPDPLRPGTIFMELGTGAALDRSALSPQEAGIDWEGGEALVILTFFLALNVDDDNLSRGEDEMAFYGLTFPIGLDFPLELNDSLRARVVAPGRRIVNRPVPDFNTAIFAFLVLERPAQAPAMSQWALLALASGVLGVGYIGTRLRTLGA